MIMNKFLTVTLILFFIQADWYGIGMPVAKGGVTPGSIWSLFIVPKKDQNDVKKLVTVFTNYYGFPPDQTRTVFIPGGSEVDKEKKEISPALFELDRAMSGLYEQIRPDDSLFVYIGQKLYGEQELFFYDESSILGLPRFHFDSWLRAVESRRKFVILQYCQSKVNKQEPAIFERWRYEEFDRSISAMVYCDSGKNKDKFLPSLTSTLEQLAIEHTSESPLKGIDREFIELEYLYYRFNREHRGQLSRFLQYPRDAYQYFVLPLVVSHVATIRARFDEAVKQESIRAQIGVIEDFVHVTRYGSREEISISDLERFLVEDVGLREKIALKVKQVAIQSLAKLRADEGLRRLIYESKNSIVRRRSLTSLSYRYSADNVELLKEMSFNERDPSIRVAAIQALHRLDPKALSFIIKEYLLLDKDAEVRVAAIRSLSDYPPQDDFKDYLVRILREDKDADVRSAAARTLQIYKDFAGIDTSLLEQLSKEEDILVREAIVYALGRTTKAKNINEVSEQLKRELDRGPDEVKIAVIWSLGELGSDAEPIPTLLKLLSDRTQPNPEIRAAAAESLGKLRNEKAIEILIEITRDKKQPVIVRNASLTALGKLAEISGEKVLAALYESLKDEDDSIRLTARQSLEEIEISVSKLDESFERLLKDSSSLLRIEAVRELSKRNDPSTVPLLVQLLNDPEYEVRQAAIDVLSHFQDEKSVEIVTQVLRNKQDATARYSAVQVISANLGRQATGILLEHHQDPDSAIRAQIVRVLGGRDDNRAREVVFKAAEDRDALVRAAAAEALKLSEDPKAEEVLHRLSQDPSQLVRRVVIEGKADWKK